VVVGTVEAEEIAAAAQNKNRVRNVFDRPGSVTGDRNRIRFPGNDRKREASALASKQESIVTGLGLSK
jgi:hypothetical protein